MKKKFSGSVLLLMFCAVFMFAGAGFAATAPRIITPRLPDAYIGETYRVQIMASGTTPIYYEVSANAIANGFDQSLGLGSNTSGILTAVPTARGGERTITFRVTASNAAGSHTREFRLNIKAPR